MHTETVAGQVAEVAETVTVAVAVAVTVSVERRVVSAEAVVTETVVTEAVVSEAVVGVGRVESVVTISVSVSVAVTVGIAVVGRGVVVDLSDGSIVVTVVAVAVGEMAMVAVAVSGRDDRGRLGNGDVAVSGRVVQSVMAVVAVMCDLECGRCEVDYATCNQRAITGWICLMAVEKPATWPCAPCAK